jgi:hypothetical protein
VATLGRGFLTGSQGLNGADGALKKTMTQPTYKTLYSWSPHPQSLDGVLTMWPGQEKEILLYAKSFESAYKIATAILAAVDEAYFAGRRHFKDAVAALDL